MFNYSLARISSGSHQFNLHKTVCGLCSQGQRQTGGTAIITDIHVITMIMLGLIVTAATGPERSAVTLSASWHTAQPQVATVPDTSTLHWEQNCIQIIS